MCSYVFSPRVLVSRPANMDETVPHNKNRYTLMTILLAFSIFVNILQYHAFVLNVAISAVQGIFFHLVVLYFIQVLFLPKILDKNRREQVLPVIS